MYSKIWLEQTSRFIITAKSVSFPSSKNCHILYFLDIINYGFIKSKSSLLLLYSHVLLYKVAVLLYTVLRHRYEKVLRNINILLCDLDMYSAGHLSDIQSLPELQYLEVLTQSWPQTVALPRTDVTAAARSPGHTGRVWIHLQRIAGRKQCQGGRYRQGLCRRDII